jgi:hypothetical protein
MNQEANPRVGFTVAEIKAFKLHAVIVASIALGMFAVAPRGLGQVLGVQFAILLLPVPPLALYFLRRRKNHR